MTQPAPDRRSGARRHRADIAWLIALLCAQAVVVVPRFALQLQRGPTWDTYAFLGNALEFAGLGKDYWEIYRGPVLPFLTSLFMRAGWVSDVPLYLVETALTVAGVLGLYLLLRQRMTRPASFLGAALFLTFPDVVENLSLGLSDLAAVAVSIWIVYALVLAVRRDPVWLQVAMPLTVIAFLTRFTGGLMFFCLVFVLVWQKRFRAYLPHLWRGSLYSAAILVPYLGFYWWRFGDPFIQFGEPLKAVNATTKVGMLAGEILPSTYFVTHLPSVLAPNAARWALVAAVVAGLAAAIGEIVARRRVEVRARAVALSLGAVAVLGYAMFAGGSIVVVILGWLLLLGWWVPRALGERDDPDVFVTALVLFWLLVYFTTHSHMIVKTTRYYITMFPALCFLSVLWLDRLRDWLSRPHRVGFPFAATGLAAALGPSHSVVSARRVAAVAAYVAFAALVAFGAYSGLRYVQQLPNWGFTGWAAARTWMDANVPADAGPVASDIYPGARWHLDRRLYPAPPFTRNKALEHWLEANGVRYFVTVHLYPPFRSFKPAFTRDDVTVYVRTRPVERGRRILLIGRSVNLHLDDVLAYENVYVDAHAPLIADDYTDVSHTFIDDYDLNRLKSYDAVLLYDFRWRDRVAAERLLERYVREGGTLLVDASSNAGGLPDNLYGLDRQVFLGALIDRVPVPAAARVHVTSSDLKAGGADPVFGRFVTEDGISPWYGSVYSGFPTDDLTVLASADGLPIVSEKTLGRGRIFFVGENLVFHAFLRGTGSERGFVRRLIDYATAGRPQATAGGK
jgi:4-amino-4-deoxy-L-arabinose transferase-like glycosyltransferase